MSLINDALKRARDASFQAGNTRPATGEEAYRISSKRKPPARRVWVFVALSAVLIVIIVMLILAIRQFRPIEHDRVVRSGRPKIAVPEPMPVPAAPTVPAPVPEKKAEVIAPVELPPAPVVPESPKFVLQGISSGPGWREAMINGNTLREGEDLDGARVVAIEMRRVKLQFGEHEILLRMP